MRPRRLLMLLPLLLPSLIAPPRGFAAPAPNFSGIVYDQRPGNQLPGEAMFEDDTGRAVRLADLYGGTPLIVLLGYFHCPSLCSVIRGSLLDALGASGLVAGRDYSLLVVSIDPNETGTDAAEAKAEDAQRHTAPGMVQNAHFLTGRRDAIDALSDALGFRSRPNPPGKTFVHPAGVVFATPSGRVSSYLLGAAYPPTDIRRAVLRAGSGEIASKASPILLLCFDYDPATGRYTMAIMKVLRLAAAATVAAIVAMIAFARLRESRF